MSTTARRRLMRDFKVRTIPSYLPNRLSLSLSLLPLWFHITDYIFDLISACKLILLLVFLPLLSLIMS